MILYHCSSGPVVHRESEFYRIERLGWDELINADALVDLLRNANVRINGLDALLPPIATQEVWAAGVTYQRSRKARLEEVHASGAGDGDFYSRVYDADRPELFFKSTPGRVVGHEGHVRIRRDSNWQVPEPELAVVANARGQIIGWTIGNDMSARDIEGINPLYLPQAKIWDGACALGPGIVIGPAPGPDTKIMMSIHRGVSEVFAGNTSLASMKRQPQELLEWLMRECTFPSGVVLLTGTGVVPPADFTLRVGDEIRITIDGGGTLINHVSSGTI